MGELLKFGFMALIFGIIAAILAKLLDGLVGISAEALFVGFSIILSAILIVLCLDEINRTQ